MNRTKNTIVTYLLTALLFIPCLQIKAQNEIATILSEEGFEDIRYRVASDTLYLSIEDRAHRGTFRGAAVAIKQISDTHSELQQFEIVLTDYKTPQLIVHASKREGIWDVSVDRNFDKANRLLKGQETTTKSTGKIDVTPFPLVSLVNNKLDHLYDYSVRIAPAVATTLWKGSRLTLQPVIPILHNLQEGSSKRYIQIGNTNISQQWLSTKHWHISSALGFFYSERMGIQTKVEWHALRGLDLSVDAGYTGLANYDTENGFGINKWNRLNYMVKADYYEPYSKLQLEVAGGQFLFGDHGVRADLTRHFGEYAIGVYAIRTNGEDNYGFHFAIPVGGKRQKRSGAVRLRLPEYYSFQYSYQAFFKYYWERMGEGYVTQPDQNHAAHYWEPEYVQHYVGRILNGTFD